MPAPKPPQVVTRRELPFYLLDPREFERLCLWLVTLENYEDAQHLGAAGSDQGRDILAYRRGKRVAIQCKRVRRFSGKDAEREIDKLLTLPAGAKPDEIEFIVSADVSANARSRAQTKAAPIPCRFRALTELDLTVKKYPEVVQEFFEGGVRYDDARPRPRPPEPREPIKPSDPDEQFDVFISYNSSDHDAAETLAYRLLDAGVKPFLDRWYLTAGLPWQDRLQSTLERCGAVLVVLGPRGLGPWQHREQSLALDRQTRNLDFPVIPLLLPDADPPLGFLRLNTWIDWRTDGPATGDLEALLAVLRDGARETDIDIRATVSPYRSLEPFREEDAPFFFGRTAATASLEACLARQNFVAVVGDSGSGKSSLVQAGLLPRLRRCENQVWEVVTITPGDRPLQRLAAALLPLLEPGLGLVDRLRQARKLTADLREPEALSETVRTLLDAQQGTDRLLIVVDQWEELYTQGSTTEDQQDFMDQLLDATARAPLSLVMTVRGDFFGKVAGHRLLADRLWEAVVPVGPMNEEELEQAILGPAKAAGLELDSGLAGRIRDDVVREPGSLPLLEFVLGQLWEKRRGNRLSAEAYDAMRGIRGALAQHAEAIYKKLSSAEQSLLPRIFGRLVRPEGKSNLRRRARLSEFAPEVHPLLWKLADLRLLVTGRDAYGEETLEVPHEALLERWSRLTEWIDADREFLLWRQRTMARRERWVEVDRDEGTLLRGAELDEAERWLAERYDDIEEEGDLIEASSLARIEDRRRTSRLRLMAAAASVIALLLVAGWIWQGQSKKATELRRTRTLTILAAAERSADDPTLAALFLRELKLPVDESLEFRVARIASHASQRPMAEQLFPTGNLLDALDFTSDLSQIVTAGADGTVFVWSTEGTEKTIALEGHVGAVNDATFSPDENRIVTAGDDGTARIWSPEDDGKTIVLAGHKGTVNTASFSPAGNRIVTAGDDGTARIWSADGSGKVIEFSGHEGAVNTASFSPDGNRIVTFGADGTVRVWRADGTRGAIVLKGHEDEVNTAIFSHDGNQIVTAGDDGTARVWRADGTRGAIVLRGHEDSVFSASFSPDGSRVVTAGEDGTARLWNADGTGKTVVLKGHDGFVFDAEFSPDGNRIVTAGADGTARIWNTDGDEEPIVLAGNESWVLVASFSSDGSRIVTVELDGAARLWNANLIGEPTVLEGPVGKVSAASFSPDGRRIVTVGAEGTTQVWSTDGERQSFVLEGHEGDVNTARFSPDSHRIVTAGDDGTARVWSADGPGPPIVLTGHESAVNTAHFSPDGHKIVTASEDKTARVWSVDDHEETLVFAGHEGAVNTALFSPDGRKIVTASDDKTARVWDSTGSGQPTVLTGHEGRVYAASFSPDSQRVLTVTYDGPARVWSADGQGGPIVLEGFFGWVLAASFSPDGRRIVTGHLDGTTRVWHADGDGSFAGDRNFTVLRGHVGLVLDSDFSPDGNRIVTVGQDGTARVSSTVGVEEPIVLGRHGGSAYRASFSPDGRRVLTVGEDGKVRLWRVDAQALLDHLSGAVRGCIEPSLRIDRLGETPEVASAKYEKCLERQNLSPRK